MGRWRSLPVEFLANRMFAHSATSSGSPLTFLMDSGGGGVLISADAAARLGLVPRQRRVEGIFHKAVKLPTLGAGSWMPAPGEALVLEDMPAFMHEADGLLGQSWHDGRAWLFDYPGQRAWTWQGADAPPEPGGAVVALGFAKSRVGRHLNGFASLTATVDGRCHRFLLDTGATLQAIGRAAELGPELRATSFIIRSLFDSWRQLHPDWEVVEEADVLGRAPMIRVPEVQVGGLLIGPVYFTARPDSNFRQSMSKWMDRPIDGALGGSLWQHTRLLVDYRAETLRLWV